MKLVKSIAIKTADKSMRILKQFKAGVYLGLGGETVVKINLLNIILLGKAWTLVSKLEN